eukprot:NODE_253_length_12805_cov_0.273413.p1 type:complete len:1341 gc:universal NODE_253_length_12805_cov_0.273413:7519-3497(-)
MSGPLKFKNKQEFESHLQNCIKKDISFTQISDSIYISALDIITPINEFDSHLAGLYYKSYKDSASFIDDPHLFKLLNDMYLSMRRTSKDQCLHLFGNDLKVNHLYHISSYLHVLSGSSNRTRKLMSKSQSSVTLIQAMSSINADYKFSFNTQFQFSNTGKWIGTFLQPGPFDDARVINHSLRNFNIFYALLAGCPGDLKTKYHLNHENFRLLNGGPNELDESNYTLYNNAFESIGFSADMISLFWQIIAALLHLSNIDFTTSATPHSSQTVIANESVLAICSGLLQVDLKSIEASLTISTTIVNNTACTQLLNVKQSIQQRDLIIKQLYSLLFAWLIEYINKKQSTMELANSIWVLCPLQIKSKEKSHELFSLLCNTNYESSLHTFFNKAVIDPLNILSSKTTVSVPSFDQLAINVCSSTLSIIQSESNKHANNPNALSNYGSLHAQLTNKFKNNPFYCSASSSKSFGLIHYNGNVYYDCSNMMNDNITTISSDLIALCVGSAEFNASLNGILHVLCSSKSLKHLNTNMNILIANTKSTSTRISKFNKSPSLNCKHWALFQTDHLSSLSLHLLPSSICEYVVDKSDVDLNAINTLDSYKNPDSGVISSEGIIIGVDQVYMNMYRFRQHSITRSSNSVFDDASIADTTDTVSNMDNNTVYEMDDVVTTASPSKTTSKSAEIAKTPTRKRWVFTVKLLTCCMPNYILSKIKKNADVRMAFREKVALNIIILIISVLMLFVIIFLGPLVCPINKTYNLYELSTRRGLDDALFAINGRIYPLKSIMSLNVQHSSRSYSIIDDYGGKDISLSLLPIKRPNDYCSNAKKGISLSLNPTILDANSTLFASSHNRWTDMTKLNSFISKTPITRMLSWQPDRLMEISKDKDSPRSVVAINNAVYDLSGLVNNANSKDFLFLDDFMSGLTSKLINNVGTVVTDAAIIKAMTNADLKSCMQLFYAGVVDESNSFKCQLSNYLLLSTSAFMVLLIFVKFISALKSIGQSNPVDLNKYCIIQVPCYTESLDSIKKTIDSIALLDYNDSYKLMFIVVDGMVMGSGNDKCTGDIVLDILGVDVEDSNMNNNTGSVINSSIGGSTVGTTAVAAVPLSFVSIGESRSDNKQHNKAKVYSGLYELEGHLVPFIVVIKVGQSTERIKPGNRGKRDSQMILMRWLNKVLYNTPMSPLELELYHHCINIIGIDPNNYDLLLMVDADTKLTENSLSHLVSSMTLDTKVIGICGETKLANENDSLATMIQVYEYYISHHLSKAFEHMFGSVTCLPGCFCMYRIRSNQSNVQASQSNGTISTAYLVNNNIIKSYGDCQVDTLHKKNLLSLGEDRYLTTVLFLLM